MEGSACQNALLPQGHRRTYWREADDRLDRARAGTNHLCLGVFDSPQQIVLVILFVVAAVTIIYLVRVSERRRYEQLLAEQVREARKASVAQSRSTLKGQIAEQMAPLLPGFPYQPADARFLGDPIDYVLINGATAFRDEADSSAEVEIVLLEIKHGQSKLSPLQRAIAKAVEEGRIRFELTRIAEDGAISTTVWRSAHDLKHDLQKSSGLL